MCGEVLATRDKTNEMMYVMHLGYWVTITGLHSKVTRKIHIKVWCFKQNADINGIMAKIFASKCAGLKIIIFKIRIVVNEH